MDIREIILIYDNYIGVLCYIIQFSDPTMKKAKCHQYWPELENEVEEFDHMHIKLLGESKMQNGKNEPIDDIIQRTFEISNTNGGNFIYLSIFLRHTVLSS